MADTPRGFVPVGHLHGGTIRSQAHRIAYNYTTALFTGDAVILTSGNVTKAADDSAAILGVFAGCEYKNDAGEVIYSPYWPGVALTDTAAVVTAHVYVDPGIIYEVQADTGSTTSQANIGVAYDIELDHAGKASTGQSGMELDTGDTGSGQFMVIGKSEVPGNDFGAGANTKLLVVNNLPLLA